MSLSREFNTLSGKIINIAEFRAKLEELGLDPNLDAKLSQADMLRKVKELEAAGEDLDNIEPATYIAKSALHSIEEKALRESDEDIAYARIADEMRARGSDEYYFEIYPAAKVVALFIEDAKLVEKYITAAKACTDYRNQVDAGELRDTLSAFEGIARKIEAKFNR